jgi:hypothetical protein
VNEPLVHWGLSRKKKYISVGYVSHAEERVGILSRSIKAPIHSDSSILDNVLELNVKTTRSGGTECKTALSLKFHVRLIVTALITFTNVVCY